MWQVNIWLLIVGMAVGTASAQQLNDPTAPPQSQQPSSIQVQRTDLKLTAIQQQASTMVAYINGKRVIEGERLPPYTITTIKMDHVVVRHANTGNEFKLSLYTQSSFLSDSTAGAGGQNE
ncbi:hypothetical protein PSI9734_01012 [Pseudidiomarina piscicola]|uniref:MSHA biogenesis protein MshK n=1 Tax=Pseudidiomarina piscicola TaxID=2614830 RepID=A0A6S6WKY9_9GAMM|nr:hypothetical protein [Pseudidiomarina piscicola]CAB0150573.1 hypothetical protein PSI9734_01012 [Pseudidiomarina piscicola]VZT40072.1 hypothetical protein PSI9734_01012 [Pseudomonas aeruginosa]